MYLYRDVGIMLEGMTDDHIGLRDALDWTRDQESTKLYLDPAA